MLVRGENFPIMFDSGTECSLGKESFASKLSVKRASNVITLKVIGNANVQSTIQIDCDISGNCLNVIFHVIPDECMRYNIHI